MNPGDIGKCRVQTNRIGRLFKFVLQDTEFGDIDRNASPCSGVAHDGDRDSMKQIREEPHASIEKQAWGCIERYRSELESAMPWQTGRMIWNIKNEFWMKLVMELDSARYLISNLFLKFFFEFMFGFIRNKMVEKWFEKLTLHSWFRIKFKLHSSI